MRTTNLTILTALAILIATILAGVTVLPSGSVEACEDPDPGCVEGHTAFDIKPESCPNELNRNSNGKLPVALLGTDDFDPQDVDISTVQLSRADGVGVPVSPNVGPPGPRPKFEDVGTPFPGELPACHDLAGDGVVDLLFKFPNQDVVAAFELDFEPSGSTIELKLTGSLLDGTPFHASDTIFISG